MLVVAAALALPASAAPLTVVSDVDDTIKVTRVRIAGTRLRNPAIVFDGLHSWDDVPGMAALYRRWQSATRGDFIYLSAGPERYRRRLSRMIDEWGCPKGTILLHKGPGLVAPHSYKLSELLPRLCQARAEGKGASFVLVGDSGERDPEVYGEAARQFPAQVAGIFIRQVPRDPPTEARYARAFAGVPVAKVHLFREVADLEAFRRSPLPALQFKQHGLSQSGRRIAHERR